ncbi:interferon kappa [Orycteropus afer afer]|uniref:Interferon kappa n=1 Tax=Orycteropus afer afer TaxID=1230840 RepID=A0A8B7AJT7_ORYAF|nr:interferon kappa [Orycteropus afer afer]
MSAKPDAIQNCLWPACLVGLLFPSVLSLECGLLNVHLNRVTWQNLRILNKMSDSFPVECLTENKDFELPQKILSYTQPMNRDIMEAFYEMFSQVFNIFSRHAFKSAWEEKHLKQIQIGLDQQIEYLERCLEEEEKENEDTKQMEEISYSGAREPLLSNLELRRYFNRIGNFLKDKKYSHCAWEIVRLEIRKCFYYLQTFTMLLRRK